MQPIDWIILIATLAFIIGYGTYKTRKNTGIEDYLKGGNRARWWTVGLSVMATQASAITFLSTPGQAFHDGLGFVQFYFGLPIAVVIICLFFIPIYHKLKVYTAYQYLEGRFDKKVRTFTAFLFLIQRGLGAGITIYAPAIVLSAVLGWDLNLLCVVIGILVIVYTVIGGTAAVNVTQKQQMIIILGGMVTAFVLIVQGLPEGIGLSKAFEIAAASGKMEVLDYTWDLNERYTVWTGILGGTFLSLSYFGTDQSQVQRYLSAQDSRQAKLGLLFNGLLKVPLQFFILLTGVMVFVFYQNARTPVHFNPKTAVELADNQEFQALEDQHEALENARFNVLDKVARGGAVTPEQRVALAALNAQDQRVRNDVRKLLEDKDDIPANDKDYVFISYILKYLPRGLVGLLLAVILSAAMSSTASELNALGTTTTVDMYRSYQSRERSDQHYLLAGKGFTLLWGVIAICFALFGTLSDNLIQLVNIVGSIFYGTVLGVFLVAFFIKHVKAQAILIAAIISQATVIYAFLDDWFEYLWLNAFGAVLTVVLSLLIQQSLRDRR